jgi:D-serine deaminase-like pyridoxal phosphate-dependent protein
VAVLVECDMGMQRVGVQTPEDAVALARRVGKHRELEYAGIAFYAGHIREPVDQQDEALRALDARLGRTLTALRQARLEPRVVSGGSTPTAWRTHEVTGVTEMRPGTYIYNDRTTAAIGACTLEDCALTVLATVVSTAVPGQAVIDTGSKSLGREPMRGSEGEGFGVVHGREDVIVRGMSEEHGILDLSRSDWRPRVGDRVRVVPNHVCIVVHLFDVIHGLRGDVVETSWQVAARGRVAPSVVLD